MALLYRDIKGRREDLKPLFAIGGVYDVKNPVFSNVVDVKEGMLQVNQIKSVMYSNIKQNTKCGLVLGKFWNENEIKAELNAADMPSFFWGIEERRKGLLWRELGLKFIKKLVNYKKPTSSQLKETYPFRRTQL